MVQRFSSIHDLVQGRVALKDVAPHPFIMTQFCKRKWI